MSKTFYKYVFLRDKSRYISVLYKTVLWKTVVCKVIFVAECTRFHGTKS